MSPQKRTNTTIDMPDYLYCKKHNLKFSHLIRAGIRDHRAAYNDPDAVPTTRELYLKIENLMKLQQKLLAIIQKHNLEKEIL